MRTKILILAPARLNGVDRQPGEEAELEDSLLNKWIELGLCEVSKEDVQQELTKDEDTKEDQPELKHLGGGYYEMPDGSKIKGKEAAIEALKAFDVLE